MKTIIVPIDFSVESLVGLNFSLMLANKSGADIIMIHVIAKNKYTNQVNLALERQLAKTQFEDIQQQYKGKYKQTGLTFIIKEGTVFKEVTGMADTFEDSIIILSTHGESGFEELFIGGNAYKITSHSKVPAITIRINKLISNVDKIVLPLDITFQTREKVPFTAILAKLFNSEIHILSVRNSRLSSIEAKLHQYVTSVAAYLDQQNIPFTIQHLQGDNLCDLTLDYARSVDADLISIMTEQEKCVSNLLLGSYAHQMINKSFIPVLSFPIYPLRVITEDIWDIGAFNARS